MTKFFYLKLAATNLKKNHRTYLPYMLACIFNIAMFYIMYTISQTKFFSHESLTDMLRMGNIVIGIFAVVFLFYTNSFLVKRRQMEFGLFNVLGMEKKHIGKIISIETLYTALISISLGLVMGMLLSKLVYLILEYMIEFKLKDHILVSPEAMVSTLILFVVIFGLTLLNSLRLIHLSKPIELLRGGHQGEKEPKTKILLTILGVAALGAGYYLAVSIQDPLDALIYFFVAVILVIIGTYCLFTSISIFVLKLLRKNKNFYYKTSNFISVSGMIYRMKQNAVGLANICILATIVLVTISTTISLYIGVNEIMEKRYPKDITINYYASSEQNMVSYDKVIEDGIYDSGLEIKDEVSIRYAQAAIGKYDNGFKFEGSYNSNNKVPQFSFIAIPLEDFNRITGKSHTLMEGEAYVLSNRDEYKGKAFNIGDDSFKVKKNFTPEENSKIGKRISHYFGTDALQGYFLVVNDINTVKSLEEKSNKFSDGEADSTTLHKFTGFDVDGDSDRVIELGNKIKNDLNTSPEANGDEIAVVEVRSENINSFYELYGGLFFLGIYLGAIFIMATVLIIYYKQLSEGYEDKERFRIMQNVGLTKKEVKNAIRSQVLTMFFLPLIVAAVHIAFAFPMISKLLLLFYLDNTKLFILCTAICLGVFTVFYILVYTFTAKVYYKIVEE